MAQENNSDFKKMALGFAVVSEVIAYCIVGYFIGRFLDERLTTHPWLTVLFVFLGLIAGFYKMYKAVMKDENEK